MRSRQRPALAMVELIFALVIIGIAMMAAPTLIATASRSTNVALQQEGINEALARVNMILTYAWDENDTNESCIPPILRVSAGDSELSEYANSGRRAGTPTSSDAHTFFCGNQSYNASTVLGTDGGDRDDIDDFIGTVSLTTTTNEASGGYDYIEKTTVNLTTNVVYIDDNASYNAQTISFAPATTATPSGTTNIKRINVTLTSSASAEELQKTIVLSAFTCNLGGISYAWRPAP